MIPLIDGDVLRYEIGACGETKDDEGNVVPRSFEFVRELFEQKLEEIKEMSFGTEDPIVFLTSDKITHDILYRGEEREFKPNFRIELAQTKPYKGTRSQEKPYHYKNLTAYILNTHNVKVAEGLEADDLMSITQTELNSKGIDTIICTRDKDLRMVDGWHYSWECGEQAAYGPERVEGYGELTPIFDDKGKIKKVSGLGKSFFFYQMLTGDTCDNIPGCRGIGKVKAYEALKDCQDEIEAASVVRDLYKEKYGDDWCHKWEEQSCLLWMVTRYYLTGEPEIGWPVSEDFFCE